MLLAELSALLGIVLRRRWRLPTERRAGTLQFVCSLNPVFRHLEHRVLVLLTLCTSGPTQALLGKVAILLRRNEYAHDPIPYAIIVRNGVFERDTLSA